MNLELIFKRNPVLKYWTRGMLLCVVFFAIVTLIAQYAGLQIFPVGVSATFFWVSLLALLAIFVPEIPEKYWFPTVLGLLAAPFLTLVIASLALLFGLPLSRWYFVVGWLLAIWLMKRFSLTGTLVVTIPCALLLWFASAFFASLTWDFSHEGERFQKPAAILLANGWNPIRTPDPMDFLKAHNWEPLSLNPWPEPIILENQESKANSDSVNKTSDPESKADSEVKTDSESKVDAESKSDSEDQVPQFTAFDVQAVQFFPKGQIILSAIYSQFFGNPEAGDSVYLLLIVSSFFLFYRILSDWLALGKYETLLLTAALVLNPMLLSEELFSGMTDGNFALSFLLFLLSALIWIRTGNRKWRPFVLGALVYASVLQFSALWFLGVVAIGYSMVFLFPKLLSVPPFLRAKSWFGLLGVACILIFLCGFHPYVTNTVRYSSPFYPWNSFSATHPAQDVMGPWFKNPAFKDDTQFRRCVFTHFDCQRPPYPGEKVGPKHDARLVSFFSLFARRPFGIYPLLLLGCVPFFLLVRSREAWLVLGVLLVGLLFYPYVWSELFAPQIRVVPVLLMAFLMVDLRQNLPPENGLLYRGNALFRTILGLLVWSYAVTCGWVFCQQYFMASQCYKMGKMMEIQPDLTMGTYWEILPFPAGADGSEFFNLPRPIPTFYFQQILTPGQIQNVKFSEAPEKMTLLGWNLVLQRSLAFTFPFLQEQKVQKQETEKVESLKKEVAAAETGEQNKTESKEEKKEEKKPAENLGSAFNQVPVNVGSTYKQFLIRVVQFERAWIR